MRPSFASLSFLVLIPPLPRLSIQHVVPHDWGRKDHSCFGALIEKVSLRFNPWPFTASLFLMFLLAWIYSQVRGLHRIPKLRVCFFPSPCLLPSASVAKKGRERGGFCCLGDGCCMARFVL